MQVFGDLQKCKNLQYMFQWANVGKIIVIFIKFNSVSETIPSCRISTDPSDSQLHVGASSLQFTPLIFFRVQVMGLGWPWKKLHFVLSDTFLCWFWCLFWVIWVILMEDPTTAHYWISSRSGQVLIFYLLVFDRIHDTMYLNKMSRTSSRKIGPQH